MSSVGELVISMSADVARIQSDMGKAKNAVQQACNGMETAGKMATTALMGIGGALAGYASLAGIRGAIDASHQLTNETYKLTLALGGTLEQAGILNIALKEIGLSSEEYTSMVLKMDRQLKTHADLFDTLGIKTKDASGQLLDQKTIMDNSLKVMLSFAAGTDRNVVSTALFGRSAENAAEFIRLTSEQMTHATEVAKKLGLEIDEHGVATMHKYQQSIADGKLALTSMWQVLEGEFSPLIVKVSSNFVTNMGIMKEAIKIVKNEVISLVDAVERLYNNMFNGGWQGSVGRSGMPTETLPTGNKKLTADQIDALSGEKGEKKAKEQHEALVKAYLADELKKWETLEKWEDQYYKIGMQTAKENAESFALFEENKRREVEETKQAILADSTEEQKALFALYDSIAKYDARIEKEKQEGAAAAAKYTEKSIRIEDEKWRNIGSIVENQLGQISSMMDKGNRHQFEEWKALAMGEAIISTSLAIAGILGAEAKLGVAAIPLATMAGAIGAAQVGIIASEQYQGREMGGPVNPGQPYIVGERGPELFTPGSSGMITANNRLGGGVNIVNNYDFRNASPETEQRMRVEIARSSEKTKSDIFNSMQRGGAFARASGRLN